MEPTDVIRALSALAQDTRLAAFRLLVQQGPSGMAAGEIAEALDTAPATLSFHLKELANAGLVTARQEGRFVYYCAHFEHMNRLLSYLTENCCAADCGSSCTPTIACAPARKAAAGRKPQRSKA
ncbi:MAG TPA: metalloregulator ArsR/SmtB family transcription factor [Burkholderiaceae bacterium]|nr:metalloregulator ArsR/SmtB family transcription factor [Burkholderiaceae bacterium]HQR70067.1 metalloregulator ArsR/SmtB family transcription factor [Burkholderiaceae bacterium]